MNIFFHLIVGIALRVFVFYSKLSKTLQKIFLFDTLPYSMENLKENEFAKSFDNKPNSHMYFISTITQKLFSQLEGYELVKILLFSVMDVMIGLTISYMMKRDNKTNNHKYILEIYLYNPLTVLNCVALRLDIFYTFINLLFIVNIDSVTLSSLFLVLSSAVSPGFIFINLAMVVYILLTNQRRFFKMLLMISGLWVLLLNYQDMIGEVKEIYCNYYTVQDSFPNFGMMWALMSESFLKYKGFYQKMLVVYQILILAGMITLVQRTRYLNKLSLLYALCFLSNHIIDRYPSENHYIISLLLLLQHWEVINAKHLPLAVYCSFAGVTLIFSRAYPYKLRRMGSSNYLYFQNLFYASFLVFVLMCAVHSINSERKNANQNRKIKEIVDDIINKIINQQQNLLN